ncbi:cytochrome c oxidase assembly factor Coa1 family protein [Sandaracinus amylolyticus]|uniref:cytochrome c oxidase assembly factor Coa1 family protein n=1 Tax=Sandaracinus amylolyticus TaxID=927083 RepID=UPI001F1C3850|nr:cytochrome c oxidase assembly factor Coa1 family protein [Sandaracinus amylolyticus]UJR85815.1 Hypothetical protein I5071_78950 [Sandaracinus amylolyticus]
MEPTTPAKTSGAKLLGMLGGIVPFALAIVGVSSAPSCMGFEDPTLRAIEACPAAIEALGTPVSRTWLGCSCGNAETSDAFGQASWTFPVAGTRDSGSVSVVAERRGGPWQLLSAQLEVGDRTIDVLQCVDLRARALAIPTATYDATVRSIVGTPPVREGASCRVAIAPSDGDYPCHVRIACGDVALYGSDSLGYASCHADAHGALVARDPNTTSSGGDPMLDLRLGEQLVIVSDQDASGTWLVELALAP